MPARVPARISAGAARLALAALQLTLGALAGLGLLELTLRAQPGLLLRGMAVSAPVDAPLTTREYDVRYSDADVFTWRPDLIRAIPAGADQVEAHVVYQTDELGFRNPPPLPEKADVVVLGRSISLAAHLPNPWPARLAQLSGLRVINLSQPGSGIHVRTETLEQFGLPRRPRWVIVEVVPSIDFLDGSAPPGLLSERLLVPLAQSLLRGAGVEPAQAAPQGPVYPLEISLPGRSLPLTCCLHYMDFFTLDRGSLEQSRAWATYRAALQRLVGTARSGGACVALLYAPTKPDLYFPLASNPAELAPTLREVTPLGLAGDGTLILQPGAPVSVETVRRNTWAGRQALEDLARQAGLPLIDPTERMSQAVLGGEDPFMAYDSHWNALGHELVAQTADELLRNTTCP